YLRRACAGGDVFALCRFDRLPLADSDDILWSRKPSRGVFALSDAATRQRLEREDLRFALAAFAADPAGQVAASFRNAMGQLVRTDVGDSFADQRVFVIDGYWRRTSLPRMMPDAAACLPRRRCAPRIPPLALGIVDEAAMAAAVLFCAWRLTLADMRPAWRRGVEEERGDEGEADRRRIIRLALLAGLILLANAAVCGVLSGPFPRYQARLAWIAVLTAGLLFTRLGAPVACRRGDKFSPGISYT
ncbi:MAG: hypothetical protein WA840_22560, partial [Caulobacteraceae bacterium]